MDLVTGATGFVGPHLVRALVARGRAVRCVVRRLDQGARLEKLGAAVVVVPRFQAEALGPALEGVDRVFHLAGGGKVSAATEQGLRTLRAANVDALDAMLRAARGATLRRFVCLSSISAMGVKLDVRLDEQSPCEPKTPHEVVKAEAERVALQAYREGLPVVILRPSQIYGPGDRSEVLSVVRLADKGLVPLFAGGEGRVPWVFISDVIDACLAAAEEPQAVGRTYIVSDAEPYRFADVVQAMARALGRRRGGVNVPLVVAAPIVAALEGAARLMKREPLFTAHRLASLTGRRMLSIERARRELGYEPRVGLVEGMDRTVKWYRSEGLVP